MVTEVSHYSQLYKCAEGHVAGTLPTKSSPLLPRCLLIIFQQETQAFTLSVSRVKAVFSHLPGAIAQPPLNEGLKDHLEKLKE